MAQAESAQELSMSNTKKEMLDAYNQLVRQLEQKRKALWYYNRSAVYVNTVLMVYEELEK